MGFVDRIRNAFFAEAEETTETVDTTTSIADDKTFCNSLNHLWQLDYAVSLVEKALSTFLINVDWKTYSANSVVVGNEWLRFNYSPNKRQSAPEFYKKLAHMLILNGEALIIETAKGELFVADSYAFKDGQELIMKDNTFIDVVIGDITLNRTFKENKDCIYMKAPQNENVDLVFESMVHDYEKIMKMITEGAEKALGMKLNLNLGAQAKNRYDSKFISEMQKVYRPLMRSRDAVFITYKGEELLDLTEKQRGSEVQQVIGLLDNNLKIDKQIMYRVGGAYGLPQKFMDGEFTADNDSLYVMAITMFAKPYIQLLSKKFTLFCLNEQDIINGAKIEANLDSIKFVESLKLATAIDKLIGSGAYTINEVREKIGDDPVEDGDQRFITKNYALLSEYVKGGTNNEA